jgi:hypothetical protein
MPFFSYNYMLEPRNQQQSLMAEATVKFTTIHHRAVPFTSKAVVK